MKVWAAILLLVIGLMVVGQGRTPAEVLSGSNRVDPVGLSGFDSADSSGIKARGRGRKLLVTSEGKAHLLDLGDSIDAAKLRDVEILLITRKPDFLYLLLSACGPSKLKEDDRQCGAGDECNLLWIKVNTDWKISDSKSVRYESCWSPISSIDGYKVKGRTLTLAYDDLRKNVTYTLSYDADHPESGFEVKEAEIRDGG
jgi:hypothetical protein